MELPKAPPIACWALALVFAYGAIQSNPWFIIPSVLLLFIGIHFHEEERQRKEKAQKEERDRETLREVKDYIRKIIGLP